MLMNQPKRHHWVPQFYLGYFSVPEDPGHVWIYRRESRSTFKTTIRNVAVETNLYSVDSENGQDPALEKRLAGLEGLYSQWWAKMRNSDKPPNIDSPDTRLNLARFMAIQMSRNPLS
jgi:hypothetical protein